MTEDTPTLGGAQSDPYSAATEEYIQRVPRHLRRLYRTARTSLRRQAAIRIFCLECMGWSSLEVENCTSPGCPLYKYRLPKPDEGRREVIKE